MHRTHIENGGLHLAQMIVEANQNTHDDAGLRVKFALIHEYALAVLRDAEIGTEELASEAWRDEAADEAERGER